MIGFTGNVRIRPAKSWLKRKYLVLELQYAYDDIWPYGYSHRVIEWRDARWTDLHLPLREGQPSISEQITKALKSGNTTDTFTGAIRFRLQNHWFRESELVLQIEYTYRYFGHGSRHTAWDWRDAQTEDFNFEKTRWEDEE